MSDSDSDSTASPAISPRPKYGGMYLDEAPIMGPPNRWVFVPALQLGGPEDRAKLFELRELQKDTKNTISDIVLLWAVETETKESLRQAVNNAILRNKGDLLLHYTQHRQLSSDVLHSQYVENQIKDKSGNPTNYFKVHVVCWERR